MTLLWGKKIHFSNILGEFGDNVVPSEHTIYLGTSFSLRPGKSEQSSSWLQNELDVIGEGSRNPSIVFLTRASEPL